MKIWTKSIFLRILHLLVYCRPTLIYYSGQKLDVKIFIFFPIIKSMFSHYNLKKGWPCENFHWQILIFWQWLYIWPLQPWLIGLRYWRYVCQIEPPQCRVLQYHQGAIVPVECLSNCRVLEHLQVVTVPEGCYTTCSALQ